MEDIPPPVSINWHFWPHCNCHCRFCFGTFKDIKGHLSFKQALTIPKRLANIGCEKLTFTRGEPTLCPYLGDLLQKARDEGLTTMIITNGTGLTNDFIENNLDNIDWVGISIDSSNEKTQLLLGRGNGSHIKDSLGIWCILKDYGLKLKLNTVVTSLNVHENLNPLVERLNPSRWKVFQVLLINGQNNGTVEPLLITEADFQVFVSKHEKNKPIAESNEKMQGSYVMLDPLGRFFQNLNGHHIYSEPVIDINPMEALRSVGWHWKKFCNRDGVYNW
jgi:radical S-adenosyl methionine domain-containing protein 2